MVAMPARCGVAGCCGTLPWAAAPHDMQRAVQPGCAGAHASQAGRVVALPARASCRQRAIRASPALQGARTVPRIFVDGQFIGGADDVTAQEQSGELAKLLSGKGLLQQAA